MADQHQDRVAPLAGNGDGTRAPRPPALQRASEFRERGWKPIPIAPSEKGPKAKGWQSRDFADADFKRSQCNVGVQLGEVSRGLVDIDFDWPLAARLGRLTMDQAPSFGRASNPVSHRLWRVTKARVKTKKYQLKDPPPGQKEMVLELRGDGCQTVFPGSLHPSHEVIEWTEGQLPKSIPEIDYDTLEKLCAATVLLTICTEFWPGTGNRNTFALALCGVLLRMGFEVDDVDDWVEGAAEIAGDEEAESRRQAGDTKEKLDNEMEVTGLPTLLEHLGSESPTVHKLIERLVGAKAGRKRPPATAPAGSVCLNAGMLDSAADRVQQQLLEKGALIFQRGGQLVMPWRATSADEGGDVRRVAGALTLRSLNSHALISVIVKFCTFHIEDRRSGDAVPRDPDQQLANLLLHGKERWQWRPLDGITGTPVFRPDGTVLVEPGYDPRTRLWYDAAGFELPPLPDAPTRDDALRSLEVLRRPFREYPITRPECWSALFATLMTPVVAPTVPAVPAVGISASSPGAGKTMLQRAAGIIATGIEPAAFNQAGRDEEDAKRLDSALLAGDPIIAIDNVTRPIGGSVLCSIVTNPTHKVRVLCKSETPSLSSRVQVIANGNNLAFYGDMCRRVLLIEIDVGDEEAPEKRSFDFDPIQEVKEGRSEMVAAALTVLRAWHLAGRPRPDCHQPLGSFNDWEPIRLALLWLGQADPAKSQELVHEDDPQREQDLTLLQELWQHCQDRQFKAADLKPHAVDEHGKLTVLGDALLGDAEKWSAKRVGNRLRSLASRWIDGIRIQRVRTDQKKGHVYRLELREGVDLPEPPF